MTGPGLFHNNITAGGISRHLIADDHIDHHRWMRICSEGGIAGECRTCGAYLHPHHPTEHDGRFDYEAECPNGHTINAPGGRVLARSSAHSHMPGGWWERRTRALKQEAAA